MFLFKKEEPAANAAPPLRREFLAVKAARWLGGAAQKASSSLARLNGLSAEGLKVDLESRASSAPESLEVTLTEWSKLLAVTDENPRYESSSGAPVTYRAAFLSSKAYEQCLQTAATGLASGRSCSTKPALEQCKVWQAFAQVTTLPGCESLLLQLPQLLADTRSYQSHEWAQEVAMALKADAEAEQLRSQRMLSAQRAETLRAQLRDQPAPTSPAAAEEQCKASAEAVRQYLAFRVCLDKAATRMNGLLQERREKLIQAQRSLDEMQAITKGRAQSAEDRREAILKEREALLEAPKKAVRDAENDPKQVEAEKQVHDLEEQRRLLLQELEETSQQLGQERQRRMAVLQQREEWTAQHRQKTEELERELQDLHPVKFYKVLAPKAATMTEGELQNALRRTTARLKTLVQQFQAAGDEGLIQTRHELQQQRQKLDEQVYKALQQHSRLQLQLLDQVGTKISTSVASLLDVARARADLMARGLSPELEDVYSIAAAPRRQDMRELRAALSSVETAWKEATSFWDPQGDQAKVKELAGGVLPQLEAARERISQSLQQLQRADPDLYELSLMGEEEISQLSSEQHGVPHGWEALATDDGMVYYHNLVSGTTQWEQPSQDAAVCAGWRLFQAEDGGWFYHNPYDGNGVWWPELPTYPVEPDSLESLRKEAAEG
ncbi:Hypothetical protein (Fragment) [Durusdinium trenchii]|uniref:WW domain-containing protein n=1 Tax=Durusdinium trenchii TaxID=1381693 RepID=A0ABP0RBJ9_9DINO